MTSSTSSVRTKIIDALYPLDPEGAEDAKENEKPSADADEDKRLRLASMSMLEGVSFKLLVAGLCQQGSAATWHDSASATQTVDMVSATLGTDPATRQQVCSPSHPHALLMLAVSLARPICRSSFASRLSAVWGRSTTSR